MQLERLPVLVTEGRIGLARAHDLIVIVAQEVLSIAHCRLIDRFVSETVASGVEQVAVLYVIEHDQSQRSSEVRASMTRVVRDHRPHVKGLALVHTGTGFVAAAQRGVMTMVATALGRRDVTRVFSDTESAASWLLSRLEGPLTLDTVHQLCAQIVDDMLDDGRTATQVSEA